MPRAEVFLQSGVYVYSAVLDNYDVMFAPTKPRRAVKFLLLSDTGQKANGWIDAPCMQIFDSTVMTNRFHKFFPHTLFPNAQYSVYVDGNIGIVGDITPLLDEFIASEAALGVFRHRDRTTVAEEIDACLDLDRFSDTDLQRYESQLLHMYADGMPHEQALTDNAVIFRWHQHPGLAAAMEDWWSELNIYTQRDQLSLPYILWKQKLPNKIWDWSLRLPNPYFEKYPHKSNFFRNTRSRLRNRATKVRKRLGT